MKTVIITGATRGIGYSTCLKFLNSGYNVVGSYVNSVQIAKELEKKGAVMVKADVSDSNAVDNLFNVCKEKFGDADILINNAGVCLEQKFILDTQIDEFDKVFDVNVKGVYLTTKKALSTMLFSGGKILNISSIFGLVGGSCESIYSSSKHAVLGFTKSVAYEVENSNAEVFALCVGLVDTDMNKHLSSEEKREFLNDYGLKNLLTPNKVANKIYALVNKSNVNGKIFKLNVGKFYKK